MLRTVIVLASIALGFWFGFGGAANAPFTTFFLLVVPIVCVGA